MSMRPRSTRNHILLLPVATCVPGRAGGAPSRRILLAGALLREAIRMRQVKLHEWSSFDCLESLLVVKTCQRSWHRILVLPWCLPQSAEAVVACARNAFQRTGADLLSLSSSKLQRPEIAAHGVLPTGPLGGFVPPSACREGTAPGCDLCQGWGSVCTLPAGRAVLVMRPAVRSTFISGYAGG